MLIKTLVISILSCSLLGFSIADDPSKGNKLLRTQEGMILVPSSANISSEDAQQLAKIILSQSEEVGVMVIDGKVLSTNRSITMKDVQKMDLNFEGRLIDEGQRALGAFIRIAGRVNKECHTVHSPNTCDDSYKWHDSAAVELSNGPDVIAQAERVLDKYGYVTIK